MPNICQAGSVFELADILTTFLKKSEKMNKDYQKTSIKMNRYQVCNDIMNRCIHDRTTIMNASIHYIVILFATDTKPIHRQVNDPHFIQQHKHNALA